MKIQVLIITLLLCSLKAFSDSAQPGAWGAGGMSDFTLLYVEDSGAYKKIQMKQEFVSIQMYKGFAVIKGEYWMYNTTNDTLQIRTGYPLNSSLHSESGGLRADIRFDSLSQLKVFVDNEQTKIISEPSETKGDRVFIPSGMNTNWYIWVTKFRPKNITKITVYFMVNTDNVKLTSGYNHSTCNGFVYVLETGATWIQPIESGTIVIQLMDGLKPSNINGINPDTIFTYNPENNILRYDFTDLSPTQNNNILMTLSEDYDNFDFGKYASKKQLYFDAVDKLSEMKLDKLVYSRIKFNSPTDINASANFKDYIMVLIISIFILGAIVIIYVNMRKTGQ